MDHIVSVCAQEGRMYVPNGIRDENWLKRMLAKEEESNK